MPNNAIVFAPLVAGFVFLRFFSLTRYISQTWDGTRLVFWTGVTGFTLFVLSRWVVLQLLLGTRPGNWLSDFTGGLLPVEYAGSLAGSVLLGLLLPVIGNLLIDEELAVRWTSHQGDLFRLMLTEEVGSDRPVSVTMSDNKVYIGLVLSRPSLNPREKYFRLLPTLSGYRNAERELRLTTNYAPMFEAIERGDPILSGYKLGELQILLRLDDVVSVRLFDERVFRELFSQ